MKKSHRKDVIIARIVFAVICILLIAIIASIVMFVHAKFADKNQTENSMSSQSQQVNLPPETDNAELPPVTENPQETETQDRTEGTSEETTAYVWTNTTVNMRTEPNVNSSVITVLNAGTQLEFLGEADGWVKVTFNGQEGYVCVDYITDTNP